MQSDYYESNDKIRHAKWHDGLRFDTVTTQEIACFRTYPTRPLRLDRLLTIDEKRLNSIQLQDKDLLKSTLCEMYAQGLLKSVSRREKGFIAPGEILSLLEESTKTLPLAQAIDKKIFFPPVFSDEELREGLEIAVKYRAQMQRTREIIAEAFSVSPEDLIVLPQCDYHLDVFIHPGPKGSVFLQSFELISDLLQEIARNKSALKLDDSDCRILQGYLNTSRKLHQELGVLYHETKTLLEAAGITVIPTPGIFYDVSPKIKDPISGNARLIQTFNVNFLNAISGWSEKANTYFYIASGASLQPKGRLAGVLMESFKKFMSSYQPNIEVIFVGHKPSDPNDFTEAMQWANFPLSRLGPHCLSFELETAPHKES